MQNRLKLLFKNVTKVTYYSLILGADISFEVPGEEPELIVNYYTS